VSYSYPYPSSTEVSAKTTIGVRSGEALLKSVLQASSFTVIGTSSGKHTGKIVLALDGRTVIFTPDKIFSPGERVLVIVNPLKCVSGKYTTIWSMVFYISKIKILPNSREIHDPSLAKNMLADAVHPALPLLSSDSVYDDFPAIHVTTINNPSPGNLYLDNLSAHNDSGAYIMILDNNGNRIFGRSMWGAFAQDFKPQPNGQYTYFDADIYKFKFYGLDSKFNVIDSFEAANGYTTDSHELIFLPGGGYALLAQTDELVDMSKYVPGADTSMLVIEGIIQEFDAAKNLIFEWRTRDHFAFSDPTYENFAFSILDFTHCNSIEYDPVDTTFILSSRNLDEVTKIDLEDGSIVWRWGGKHNQFTFVNDSLIFSHQHSVRLLPNRNIIMFDNGTFHPTAMPFSRAVEYHLDEDAKIATKVWEYHHNPDVFGSLMGYVQELANGNRLIDWGACDSVAITEVKPDGTTAFELRFDPGIWSYRAFKYTPEEIKAMQSQLAVPVAPVAQGISLDQNFPNPCNSSSVISFRTEDRSQITLDVYDALGRKVKNLFDGVVDAGNYSAKFDAGNLPNGSYFYTLLTPRTSVTKMMVVAK
jgi:hypothetical protein